MTVQPEMDFNKGPQFDKEEGKKLRDQGIKRAVDHADKVDPEWSKKAYDFLVNKFLPGHNGTFLTEDVRSMAAYWDFAIPPTDKAWGGVIIKAKNDGIIKSVGFGLARNKLSHRRPSTKWIQIKPSEQKK